MKKATSTTTQSDTRPAAQPHKNSEGAAQDMMVHAPAPSPWPIAMALAATVAVAGYMVHPLITLVCVAIALAIGVAWGVEGGHE